MGHKWHGVTAGVNCFTGIFRKVSHFFASAAIGVKLQTKIVMPSNDYIPAKLTNFAAWLANYAALLTTAPATYGLTAPDAVAVQAAADDFAAAFAISNAPATRTSAAIANTTAQRAIATGIVRPYAVRISSNDAVDDGDKVDIGVTVRSTVITPIPAPTTQPALSLLSAQFLKHTLRYFDVTTPTSKKKPFGVKALQVWRNVGVAAATDPIQCQYYGDFTKSPMVSEFEAGDRGKQCTYFTRWVTVAGPGGKAQTGPWSDALVVTVV